VQVSWFGLKTKVDSFSQFGLKTDGFGFLSLGLKTGSYGLVIWATKLLRRLFGLCLKMKWAMVYRFDLHHNISADPHGVQTPTYYNPSI
jgi:hypothetical protein